MLHHHVNRVAKVIAQFTSKFLHLLRLVNHVNLEFAFNVLRAEIGHSIGKIQTFVSLSIQLTQRHVAALSAEEIAYLKIKFCL
jgi:hypothetical protein